MLFYLLLFLLGLVHPAWSQLSSPHNFLPGAYPLAVRSPYLNSWLNTPNGTVSPNIWPTHWDTRTIMGWTGFVRVDGTSFVWLGQPIVGNNTVLRSTHITPTRTVFTIVAGSVLLNVTFISPIEPADLVLQSLPFAYVAVDVVSNDGKEHSVQVYSDISGEWISADRTNAEVWNTTQSSKSVYHQARRTFPGAMQENNGIAEDASVIFAMGIKEKLTWQTGSDADVRNQFVQAGNLTGLQDTDFRAINARFPVFGLSVDLGTISATTAPVVWVLGIVRDPVIQYPTQSGSESRSSYFWTRFSQISDVIDAFVSDFPAAEERAIALDQRILSAAQKVSDQYADLVSLGLRQTLAGIDFTISKSRRGGWNQNDIKAFIKDTGSSTQVNAIETVYAAFPAILFLNASLSGYLLEPMLAYQSSSLYHNDFAAANLGAGYPVALGNNVGESVHAVDASGKMIAMVWAHATFSGQGQLIANYYDLLKKWADYLVANTMDPAGQTMDSLLPKPKMTNLLLQGIIGIRAMSAISAAAGHQDDADKYMATATSFIQEWKRSASTSDHLASTLDPTSPPSLVYNIFIDRMLNFKLVDDSLIDKQSRFYISQSQNAPKFGLPLDNGVPFAKTHWTAFTAAASNNNARDTLIGMIYSRINVNSLPGAFPAVYDVQTGSSMSGFASPTQGGLLSVLALNLPSQKLIIPPKAVDSESPGSAGTPVRKNKVSAGAIAGGVIGGIAILFLLGIIFLMMRRRRQQAYRTATPSPFLTPKPAQTPSNLTDFEQRPLPMTPITSSMYAGYISPVTSSFVGTSISGTSARTRSTRTGQSSSTAAETSQLRSEVEDLRRAMNELRAQREYDTLPPPGYQ